jgi:hypothetical protein
MNSSIAIIDQGIDVPIGDCEDAAAITAVTAVRAATGDEFFTTEAHCAIAALAGMNFNTRFVEKLHIDAAVLSNLFKQKNPAGATGLSSVTQKTQALRLLPCAAAVLG